MILRRVFRHSAIFSLIFVLTFGASFAAQAADALPAGCNGDVWEALKAKAEAQVAYDVAVTRAIVDKPDSVLALSCFDKAAAVSAKKGGEIFAGDFTDKLKTVMTVDDNGGNPKYDCDKIGAMWDNIVTQGVNTGAPYATFDDLLKGQMPAGTAGNPLNPDFVAGWKAASDAGIFTALNDAAGPTSPLPKPVEMDFSKTQSSFCVLVVAGVLSDQDCKDTYNKNCDQVCQ